MVARWDKWDDSAWGRILAPFVTGEPQRAYHAMSPTKGGDYAALKREILARTGVSSVTATQQCHEWIYKDSEPVHSQMAQLTHLAHLWLTPESTTASKVTEKLVIDQLLRALPSRFQGQVSMKDPKT